MRLHSVLVLSFFALLMVISCRKDRMLTSGGQLRFSTDTLTFDTVFTSLGSFTIGVKLFNQQDQKINISSVRLEQDTFFHLNVNGISGNDVRDIEVAANDSIYVFVTVNIDPRNVDNPYIIENRLIATLNGKDFSIPLIAYGQDANYYVDTVIAQSITWTKDRPYVIMKNALVDSGVTLNMEAGTRVYVHADSRLFVSGKLEAIGTKKEPVTFQSDRLDREYFGNFCCPGEWGGIYFTSSSNANLLEWVVLRNAGNSTRLGSASFLPAAVQVNGGTAPRIAPQLTIKNTIIENSIGYGIISFGASIKAQNSLVHDCGAQALAILEGGVYEIINCDFINYAPKNVSHINEPTVAVLNYRDISNTDFIAADLNAIFKNCLIYGTIDNELFCNWKQKAQEAYNVSFDHCLIRSKDSLPGYVSRPGSKFNMDPSFVDHTKWNFRVKSGSPVIDAGTQVNLPLIGNDLDDTLRVQGNNIDIGCYERAQ